MPEDFRPPVPKIGDIVFWFQDALSCSNPVMGWVVEQPGTNTITVMTASSFGGLQFRPSVRHKDDPGLQEHSEWRQWGAWAFAPITEKLNKLDATMADLIALRERLGAQAKQHGK
jgi:hypothetical protein